MIYRRNFIKTATGVAAGFGIGAPSILKVFTFSEGIGNRIPFPERKFHRDAVERTILQMRKEIRDQELGLMFENCFPNTLDTTVIFSVKNGGPDIL